MIESTEVIVLSSRKFGDTSKIVSLLSERFGKISVMAKGARASKNKIGSGLEPMSISTAQIYFKPQRDLHLLKSIELSIPLRRIADSFDHLSVGLAIIESITISQPQYMPNPELFHLAKTSFQSLNTIPVSHHGVLFRYYLELSEVLGYHISLPMDVLPEGGRFFYSMTHNHLQESRKTAIESGLELSATAVNTLRKLSREFTADIREAGHFQIDSSTLSMLNEFFRVFFSHHLERPFGVRTGMYLV